MSFFLEEMAKAGVDVSAALERFAGDEETYEMFLRSTLKDRREDDLGEIVADKRYSEAFDVAHELKGVYGNLGFDDAYTTVSEIVELLRGSEKSDAKNVDAKALDRLLIFLKNEINSLRIKGELI